MGFFVLWIYELWADLDMMEWTASSCFDVLPEWVLGNGAVHKGSCGGNAGGGNLR